MELLHPGLYKQEIDQNGTMEGSSTSTGAFLGVAPKGEIGKAVLVTNWKQYCNLYGDYTNDSYLAYAVQGFFKNGGKRAYIVRTAHYQDKVLTAKKSKLDIKTGSEAEAKVQAIISAKSEGVWGDDIEVEILKGSEDKLFSIVVSLGDVKEKFEDLEMANAEDYLKSSKIVSIDIVGDAETLPVTPKTKLSGGDDGVEGISMNDFCGDQSIGSGLYAFDSVRINLLAVPGITNNTVLKAVADYASGRQDCLAILDSPKGLTPQEVQEYVLKDMNINTSYATVYYPWVIASDPAGVGSNPTKVLPPSGYVMGVYAQVDNKVGAWRAPAGTDFPLAGILDLEYPVTDNEQDVLNPNNINCIRAFAGDGIVIWGTRTLSKGDFKYVPVRRIVTYVGTSLMDNLRWTVFRPNDDDLWVAIERAVEEFLEGLRTQGGLKGKSSKEAFIVTCDSTINTEETVNAGITYVDIGLAVRKPSEFIVFRLGLKR